MDTTRLGRTGLQVTRICLGTMTFGLQCDEETSAAILDKAFEAGVSFIDTADVYPLGGGLDTVGRTEEILGHWLAAPGRRDQVILATKCVGVMGPQPWDRGAFAPPHSGRGRRLSAATGVRLYRPLPAPWL